MERTYTMEEWYGFIKDLGLEKEVPYERFLEVAKKFTDDSYNPFEQAYNEEQATYFLHNILIELKCAWKLDWKWEPEDALSIVQALVPSFKYEIQKADFDDAKNEWDLEFTFGDQKFQGLVKTPGEILEVINPQIEKHTLGKKLYSPDSGADDYLIGLFKSNS